MAGKRALVIGLDDYPGAPLKGCVADAEAISTMLSTNADGSPNYKVKTITSTEGTVTRPAMQEAMLDLFKDPQHMDLLFYFSGHGRQTRFGAELVTTDADGVTMNDLLTLANASSAANVTIILDCCFSGDMGNAAALQPGQIADEFRKNITVLGNGVVVLAASKATQVALEADGQGILTRLLLDGLNGGATDHLGRVTALSLYAFASAALDDWDQCPIFKAHVTQPAILRLGPPWLDPSLLRRLPEKFSTPDARVQMTPAHEGEGRPLPAGAGTQEQQDFDYFKKLRNAGLLTTDDEEDHYWVALNSGYVFLTPLGRYFWERAKAGQV